MLNLLCVSITSIPNLKITCIGGNCSRPDIENFNTDYEANYVYQPARSTLLTAYGHST